jgi:putative ABC transport system substrate-binding protein
MHFLTSEALGDQVKRRRFLVLAGCAMAAWPRAAAAQADKVARIGVLALGNPDPGPFMRSFREGLRELGYIEGQNIVLEVRSAGGKSDLLRARADELVELKVDIIVAFQTPAGTAAKNATRDIPIVLGASGDPVGTGLVASLSRPGGNVTGVTGAGGEVAGKNLELVREVLPSARRVAVLANASDPFHKPFLEHIQNAGRTLGIDINAIALQRADEIDAAFPALVNWQAEAVIVQPTLPQKRAADLALKHRLAAFSPNTSFPGAGGLMSYSADQPVLFRESATFVDKILKGRKPADLPVQLPTKFRLVINLKTAKALGLTVPPTLLTRADDVIE